MRDSPENVLRVLASSLFANFVENKNIRWHILSKIRLINRVRFFATQEYFDLDLPIRNMVQNSNILKQKSADHFCISDPKLLQT